jgi:SAM-dependent methyltransferase
MAAGALLRTAVTRMYRMRDAFNSEHTFVRSTVRAFAAGGRPRLLDVGCGHGRFAEVVAAAGAEYVGIDVNPESVQLCRGRGLDARLPSELLASEVFDIVLLSHVIEHFGHADLIRFLDEYTSRLRVGGVLIVLTPLYHSGFFDDFDHVKPYNPGALRQMLCAITRQTQPIDIRARFQEQQLWIKKDPFGHSHDDSRWRHLVTLPASLLTTASFGTLGRATGYGMSLRRVA